MLKAVKKLGPRSGLFGWTRSAKEHTDKVFEEMDRNGDNHLSLNEFINGVKKNPSLEVLITPQGEINRNIYRY